MLMVASKRNCNNSSRVLQQLVLWLLVVAVATTCWSSFLTVANAQVLGACNTNCSIPPNTNEPVNQDLRLNPQNYDVMGDVKVSNNSMMTLPPGAKFNLQGGQMRMDGKSGALMVGAQINLNGSDSLMRLSSQAELRVQDGSELRAGSGAKVRLDDQATMVLDNESSFVVEESGSIQVGRESSVAVGAGSQVSLHGMMKGGGKFSMSDNTLFQVQPKGKMLFDEPVKFLRYGKSNCSFVNAGTMVQSQGDNDESYYDLPVQNQGLMFLTKGKVHFGDFQQSIGWTILYTGVTVRQGISSESNVTTQNQPLKFKGGWLQGNGKIQGDVIVDKNAHMNHDPIHGTNLELEGDLDLAGSMWVNVNNQENPGTGYTKYTVKGKTRLREGTLLYVCVEKKQKEGKLEVLSWQGFEGAKFKLLFKCENGTNSIKHRISRDVDEADQENVEDEEFDMMACPPSADYSSSGLALLFSTCTGGGDGGNLSGEAFTLWVLSLCFVGGAILLGILVTILYEFCPPFRALVQNSSGPSINEILRAVEKSQIRSATISSGRSSIPPPVQIPVSSSSSDSSEV